MKRAGRLLLAGLLAARLLGSAAAAETTAVNDPWPNSPVLTRLFRLSGPRTAEHMAVQNLQSSLQLSGQQLSDLQRLATLERQGARLGDGVTDRLQARQVNTQIAALRQQKDQQAKHILGKQYPAFRQWLRQWWHGEVERSRESTQSRQLVLPAGPVPPGVEDQ